MSDRHGHIRFVHAVVNGGYWSRMSQLERGVWLVLHAFSDFESGRVAVGIDTLARLAGIKNLHRCRTTCNSLEALGLVKTIQKGGGRSEATVRQLLVCRPLSPLPWFDLLADEAAEETGTPHVPVSEGLNRAAGRAQTGTLGDRNRDAGRAQTGTPHVPLPLVPPISTPPSKAPGGPVNGVAAGGRARVARGKQEEEDFFKKLKKRGLFDDTVAEMGPLLTDDEADRPWAEVVNDKNVRVENRPRVYFRRLQRYLLRRDGH